MSKSQSSKTKSQRILIAVTVLVVVTTLSFGPVVSADFTNWDDPFLVTLNPAIQSLSWTNIVSMFSISSYAPYRHYIPVVILSYALEFHFAGINPIVFHTTNLILHVLNVLLVFWIARRLNLSLFASFVASLLFALHPMRVESVAWITERKDMLSSFFYLGTVISYLVYIEKRKHYLLVFCFLLFMLALCSKAMAVSLPFALLIVDKFVGRPIDRQTIAEKIPFLILAVALGAAVIASHNLTTLASPATADTEPYSWFDRLCIASYGLFFYLTKLVAPVHLSILYPSPLKSHGLLPLEYLIAGSGAIALGIIFFKTRKRFPNVTLGVMFFLVSIFPVLQLIPVGVSLVADRFTYIPYLGLFLMIGTGFTKLAGSIAERYRPLLATVGIFVIAALSMQTRNRCETWENSITLWTATISQNPDMAIAYVHRGQSYAQDGKFSEALSDYGRAIEIDKKPALALNNRGNVYARGSQYDLAIQDYTRALSLDSSYVDAALNRGLAYQLRGDLDSALASFSYAITLDSQRAESYRARANAFFKKGDYSSAISDFNTLLTLEPQDARGFLNRGNSHANLHQYREAIEDYRAALNFEPNLTDAHRSLALAYMESKEYGPAKEQLQRVQNLGYSVDPATLRRLDSLLAVSRGKTSLR